MRITLDLTWVDLGREVVVTGSATTFLNIVGLMAPVLMIVGVAGIRKMDMLTMQLFKISMVEVQNSATHRNEDG